jgi:predicted secreted protein
VTKSLIRRAGANRPSDGYNVEMTRIWPVAGALAVASVAAVGAASAMRPPLTQAASGKVIHLAKGEQATLRLSNRWQWSEPAASTKAVDLTPVEYFADPGFREWTIDAQKSGRAVIRALGRPNCASCALATRHFAITIVVP